MVDPASRDDLRVLGAHGRPDRRGLPEVERRTGDRRVPAERDAGRVDRGELVGEHGQQVVVDRARTLAVEVEVGVIGQVQHGQGVGRRLHLDPHRCRRRLGSERAARPIPGKPWSPSGLSSDEHDVVGPVLDDVPEPAVDTVGAAVQAVAAVVGPDHGPRGRRAGTGRRRCGSRSDRWCRRCSRSSPAARPRSRARARRCGVRRRAPATSSRCTVAPRVSTSTTGPGADPMLRQRTSRPSGERRTDGRVAPAS